MPKKKVLIVEPDKLNEEVQRHILILGTIMQTELKMTVLLLWREANHQASALKKLPR